MKHCLPLLKFSCIFLIISACSGQSTMLKEDFSEQGVSLVLPNDPAYKSELEKLDSSISSSAHLLALGTGTVLVKNTSRRAVVAFGIRFTKRSPDGHIATSDVVESQPSALLDLGQPGRYDRQLGGLVMPGAARLVTPDGVVDSSRKVYTHYRTARPWTIAKAQLDSVVFDDGQAIGPDQLGVIKSLKAHIDAQQDLMEEISDGLSHGELLHDVLQRIQGIASSKTDPRALTQSDPSKIYALVRQQYLDELSATEASAGDEVALRRLRQLRYATRPNIHSQKGGD